MTSPSGGGTRRRRPIAVPLILMLLAAGLGATAALGGLSAAPDDPPRRLGPGATVDQGRFLTTFVAARTVRRPDEDGLRDRRFLEVELEVVNRGDETTQVGRPGEGGHSFARGLLAMTPPIPSGDGPDVTVADGGVPSRQLHPDMAAAVVLRYEIPEGQPSPETVRYDVGAFERRERSAAAEDFWVLERDGRTQDAPAKVTAQVTLPVQRGEGT
ncbi:hypothetical protein ACFOWE_19195 [Planomonospora corallina]|uniref:DUF4352 domain-containing protein n=1 Tax=Planomonospora corallina TaxID=1806052 RepID=A0ABV8IAK2_9ACTN